MSVLPKSRYFGVLALLSLVAGHAAAAGGRGPAVEVLVPVVKPMPEEILVTGTLIANEWVLVAPELAGTIKALPFTEGGAIKQGDPILELDDAMLAAELRQAQASYDLAKLHFDRNEQLYKRQSVSKSVFDESAAELRERQAALDVARVKLAKTRITAPFDGYITLRDISVGAYVTPGQQLFTLVDDTPLKLEFRVPERLAGKITPGMKVQFEVNLSGEPERHEAEVGLVQPAITPASRSLEARAFFPNTERRILAGTFARVYFTVGDDQPVLAVPEQALIGSADGYFVFVLEQDQARRRAVKTGVRRGGLVAITAGLQPGVPVIVAGHQTLVDGITVNVVNRQE